MSSIEDDDLIDDSDDGMSAPKVPLSQRAMGGVRAKAAAGDNKAKNDPFYGIPIDGSKEYVDRLNDAQREAVRALHGPVLMLAGAGTGKTTTLMTRLAHLLIKRHVTPREVLAVTFTNKAANDMKKRLSETPYDIKAPLPWMGTFHALSVKMLRSHAALVCDWSSQAGLNDRSFRGQSDVVPHENKTMRDTGFTQREVVERRDIDLNPSQYDLHLKSNFSILDRDDQLRLLKQTILAAGIDEKRWPAKLLSSIIEAWKNRAWTPDMVPASEANAFNDRGIELYHEYQRRLLTLNACDFDDLILHTIMILKTHPDIQRAYQNRFRYILVDEYQDTNSAQYQWLRLLVGPDKNICCVGDDDQSIYGWRGAEVGNILRFEKDFPGAKVVRLEQNYRSTAHILAAASGVIAGNEGRLGKELWTEAEGGEKVRLIGHWDGDEEARWVGEEIEAMQSGTRGMAPKSLDDMAILVRASHQMRAFEDRFLTIGLPYRVIGGPRFYERMEIRDAMAYFRLAVSQDDDLAFERIVNTPRRGLGDKAVQTIQMLARTNGVSLVEGARIAVESGAIKGKGGKGLAELVAGLDRWFNQLRAEADTHIEMAEVILEESGYTEMWLNDKTPEAPGRLENLKELVKALESFENLQGFLEHVSLIMDNDTDDAEEQVTIMTLHAAKGLEYPAVFLPGWEDGLFPSQRSMDESGLKGLEEERRLAYVGITRAEEVCTISFAANRRVYGQWQSQLPSRFVDELPEEHVEVLTAPGLYGGAAGDFGSSPLEDRAGRADAYNSPGWKRMQAQGNLRTKPSPNEARGLVIDATAVSSFTQGDRVFHTKFGYGTVMGIEGDKLDIEFDKAGAKKVVSKFIVPAAQAGDVPF